MSTDPEVYAVLLEIKQDIGELKAKVDVIASVDARVVELEKKGNVAVGWIHAIGAAISAVVAFFVANWSAFDTTR